MVLLPLTLIGSTCAITKGGKLWLGFIDARPLDTAVIHAFLYVVAVSGLLLGYVREYLYS